MLPGHPTPVRANAPFSGLGHGRNIAATGLCVEGDLFVRVLESLDQLLYAEIVGQELRRGGQLAAEDVVEGRIEEDHSAAAQRPVGTTGLQEQHSRRAETTQLDLASSLLNEIVATVFRVAVHLNQFRAFSRFALSGF